ncbi:MAG: endonuclease domain-containing protein [Bifidobacteriaceae bacterium]|jgi:hypothetical protein|nr:endonuclease domain-containing protein [Bifidobacteriaceae bacterium]
MAHTAPIDPIATGRHERARHHTKELAAKPVANAVLTPDEARSLGLTRGQLRGPAFSPVLTGVYRQAGNSDPRSLGLRVCAVVKALGRDTVIAERSALRLWGVALPPRVRDDARIHVAVPRGHTISRRCEVITHSVSDFVGLDVRRLGDVLVLGPVDAWLLAAKRCDVEELVQIGDGLIRFSDPLCSLEEIVQRVDRHIAQHGGRGAAKLRAACAALRSGTDSIRETWLRQRIVAAGYPEPQVNAVVRDHAGRFVGRPDLYWEELKLRVEYDGQYHNDPDQHAKDTIRDRAFEALGIVCAVATKKDYPDPSDFLRHFGRLWDRQRAKCAAARSVPAR